MNVLLAGAAGQLGQELVNTSPQGLALTALAHTQFDLTDDRAVHATVRTLRPDVIINAAAYTPVDQAEVEPELAAAVNARGARYLAEAARSVPRCRLIQLSTDYVFDGQSHRPYLTTDTPRPISVYGVTKWEGENAVLDVLASRAVVLRTAWLYSAVGTNFLHSMLAAMRAHRTVRVVNDQWGAPTATPSVAAVIWQLTDRPEFSGIAHWTDQGAVTRFEWARAIAEDATAVGLLRDDITVSPVGTADYPTAARRPPYSVLDTRQTALTLGRSPAPWRDRLREILARLVMQERSPTHLLAQRLSSPH